MSKNMYLKILLLMFLTCISQFSFAATDIINAKIIDVAPDKSHGVIYVKLNSTQRGTTACSFLEYNRTYQISDLGTPISDALYSAALTALVSGKTVKVVGNGTCIGREGMEVLRLISFE